MKRSSDIIQLLDDISRNPAIIAVLVVISVVFGVMAWGLVEVAMQFFRRVPDGGIVYLPNPLNDILAKSFKKDPNTGLTKIKVTPHQGHHDHLSL